MVSNQSLYQLQCEENILSISGEMTIHTVGEIQASSKKIGSFLTVDLSHVNKADSAALALLLHWIDDNAANNMDSLMIKNIPNSLLVISKLAGLDDLFQ